MAASRIIPVVILLAACGCARHTRPIVPPRELTPAEKNFQAVWDASSEVLSSYRYTVDRRDRRAGLITTKPMASRHFFEWWRRDKTTASGALENSVQPIYREVSVQISKTDKGKYHPVVSVTVSRLLLGRGGDNRILSSYELVRTPRRQERLVIGVGSSDNTGKDSGKDSPGDDILAGKIAEASPIKNGPARIREPPGAVFRVIPPQPAGTGSHRRAGRLRNSNANRPCSRSTARFAVRHVRRLPFPA